jgi:hypothetical protein
MKALLPPSPQLDLLLHHNDLALSVVEPSVRLQILRGLAELLLAAAEARNAERTEARDETR